MAAIGDGAVVAVAVSKAEAIAKETLERGLYRESRWTHHVDLAYSPVRVTKPRRRGEACRVLCSVSITDHGGRSVHAPSIYMSSHFCRDANDVTYHEANCCKYQDLEADDADDAPT